MKYKFTKFEDIKIGEKTEFERKISEEDIDLFAKITGDFNPVHVDNDFASKTRFKGRISHGMLTASFLSRAIGMSLPGTGALFISLNCKFLSPVKINDNIRVIVTVDDKHLSTSVLGLRAEILNQAGDYVIDGKAKVMVMVDDTEVKLCDNKQVEETISTREICDMGEKKSNELEGKVALVTGSSRGIGAAIVKCLALSGANVVVNYVKDFESANKVADEINSVGPGKAITVQADVSNAGEVNNMFAGIRRELGEVDILVNNASRSLDNKAFLSLEWEDIQVHLNLILKGTYNCCMEAVSGMKKHGNGKIVNIISSLIYKPQKSMVSYMTAKYGLLGLSKSLALELSTFDITVNSVSPGMTDTDLVKHLSEYSRKITGARLPLKRLATPEDIAKVVLFLSGQGSDYMTGVDIPVCGGEYI